jgi:transposase, IS6 family
MQDAGAGHITKLGDMVAWGEGIGSGISPSWGICRSLAKHFFGKALNASHTVTPHVITVDKNAAYPKAFNELQAAGGLHALCELRQSKYLNSIVEQDHRFIKRLVKPGLGFFSFKTAWRTLRGYEMMNMIRKGQVQGIHRGDSLEQATFIAKLFGVAL